MEGFCSMKKLLSIALALALAVSLFCAPASAARVGTDSPDSSTNYDVSIKLEEGTVIHKYYVDIEYPTSLVFTYTKGGDTWDPDSYTYTEGAAGSWSDAATFKIVNHSDQPIQYVATANVTDDSYGADLSINVGSGSANIAACQVGDTDGSRFGTFTVGVSGTPNDALTSTPVELGFVNIVISKA